MDESVIGALGSLISATVFLVGFSSVRLRGQRDRVLSRSDAATADLARAGSQSGPVDDAQVLQTARAFDDVAKLDPVGRWTLNTAWAVVSLMVALAAIGGIKSGLAPTVSPTRWTSDTWVVLVLLAVGVMIAALGTGDLRWVQNDLQQRLDASPVQLAANALEAQGAGNLPLALTISMQLESRVPSWPWVYAFRAHVQKRLGDGPASLAAADRAVELDPLNVWWRIARAESRLNEGDAFGAVADLTMRDLQLPQEARAYRLLGAALLAHGRRPEALEAFNRAVELDPKSPESRLERGKALMHESAADLHQLPIQSLVEMLLDDGETVVVSTIARTGGESLKRWDLKAARADFDQVLEFDPASVAALSGRSVARLLQGDDAGSEEDFRKALLHSVKPASVWSGRGVALADANQMPEAIEALGRALDIEPTVTGFLQRGLMKQSILDHPGAIADFDSALAIDGSNADAASHRASALMAMDRTAEALVAFQLIAERNKRDRHNYDVWLDSLVRAGMYEKALEVATEAVENLPKEDLGAIYARRGRAHRALKRYRHALADFDLAAELGYDPLALAHPRAQTLVNLERIDEALEAISIAAEQPSAHQYAALATRATLHRQLRSFDAACADLDGALELMPRIARLYVSRACLLILMKRLADAHADLDKAALIGGDEASLHYHQAILFASEGNFADARTALDKFEDEGGEAKSVIGLRADFAFQSKDWPEAAKHLAELAKEGDQQALFVLGAAYDNMGEFESAEQTFRELLAIDNSHWRAQFGLAVALSQQEKSDEAVIAFGRLRVGLGEEFDETVPTWFNYDVLLEAEAVRSDLAKSAP